MNKDNLEKLNQLIKESQVILVLQPEKPDGDSLSSCLALEQILGELDKRVVMYCKDPVPEYIRVIGAWDRVTDRFPDKFDLTILVDAGGPQMLARTLEKHAKVLSAKPFFVVDHHATREPMPFETIDLVDSTSASTTELITHIARKLHWPINLEAAELITEGILSDTRGFRNTNTDAEVMQIATDMVKLGVSLPELYERHTSADALSPDLLRYKGQLLTRVEYFEGHKIALISIPSSELAVYADLHDPADLVINEMREVKGVLVAVAIRDYATKIKVSLRAKIDVADEACAHFGGGGHSRAAGFRVDDRSADQLKPEIIEVLAKLIKGHEALQHAK